MKRLLLVVILAFSFLAASGQTPLWQAKRDSIDRLWLKKADSLTALRQSEQITDSLNVATWIDSVKSRVNAFFDLRQKRVRSALDSLRGKRKYENAAHKKLDSLEAGRNHLLRQADSGRIALQAQLSGRYQRWQQKLDSIKQEISSSELAQRAGGELPSLDPLELPALPSLKTEDLAELDFAKEANKLGIEISLPRNLQVGDLKSRLNDVGVLPEVRTRVQQMKSIADDPGKAAERTINNLDPVKSATAELDKSQRALADNQAVQLAQNLDDPEALQQQAVELIKQQAMDHFADKQELLQHAMDKMGKHKRKFNSLESLQALPKHPWLPKNGLKGKPFRERVRVGLHAAAQNTSDTLIVDLFPNVSYFMTGRIEFGAGFIYRVREVKSNWRPDQRNPVWGFSGFATFKFAKGIRWRIEADATSHPAFTNTDDAITRQWRWTWLTGPQTTFNISNRWAGNVQMLYNFDRNLKAGFPDFLVMRIGVQYRFR